MARRPVQAVEADEAALLAHLALLSRKRCSRPGAAVPASIDELVSALGLSRNQVRRALRALSDDGRLVVEPRFLPNGGQTENAYRVTAAGASSLERER